MLWVRPLRVVLAGALLGAASPVHAQFSDLCEDAPDVGPLPALVVGSSIGTGFNDDPPAQGCGGPVLGPGVWCAVTGTGTTLTASACEPGTSFSTILDVYCGDCAEGLLCVATNNDCGTSQGVSWCSAPGQTYLLFVHGNSGAAGSIALSVSDDGVPCADPPACPEPPCVVECAPGSIPEGEPEYFCFSNYDDQFNAGCSATTPTFSPIACGQTICGTSGAVFSHGFFQDRDWYRFELTERTHVTLSLLAEFTAVFSIADTGGIDDCDAITGDAGMDFGVACELLSIGADLNPGVWYILARPTHDDDPCGSVYHLAMDCSPFCPDLDGDGDVDVFDFGVFVTNFGTSGHAPYANGDLDGDGDVDVFDFAIFGTRFGCPG